MIISLASLGMILGLIMVVSSFFWMLVKKKYDVAISLFIIAVVYILIAFVLKGGITS